MADPRAIPCSDGAVVILDSCAARHTPHPGPSGNPGEGGPITLILTLTTELVDALTAPQRPRHTPPAREG